MLQITTILNLTKSKKIAYKFLVAVLLVCTALPMQAAPSPEIQSRLTELKAVLEQFLTQLSLSPTGKVLGVNSGDILPLIEARGYSLSDIPVVELEAMPEPFPANPGKTYYLDANNGNDTTGDGSQTKPFKSVKKVWPLLSGGDTVKLANGNYGSVWYCLFNCNANPTAEVGKGAGSLFNDWVTFEPVTGASPAFENIRIHTGSKDTSRVNMYLKFKGLTVHDGMYFQGGDNLAVIDSAITQRTEFVRGDLRLDDMNLSGIYLRGINNVLIKGNDISKASVGIWTGVHTNITIKDNHIHHLVHDGIRLVSAQNALVEGNIIHDLDDGYDDKEVDGVTAISRHIDALHIFQSGSTCDKLQRNENVLVRGNVFYNVESQFVQINNYGPCKIWNKNFVFENNIFGQSGANPFNAADPVDGLVFRHNTFLPMPGHSFTSPFRTIVQDNSTFRINDKYERVAIYNNILSNPIALDDGHIINDWNVSWNPGSTRPAIGKNSIIDTGLTFANVFNFDGKTVSGSKNVDFGTKKYATSDLYSDFYGTTRDNRPDAGTYEIPGRNPAPEASLPTAPSNPSVFFDNFDDVDLKKDIYLNTDIQTGISWTPASDNTNLFRFVTVSDSTRLAAPNKAGTDYLFSDQGSDWKSYSVSFIAGNSYMNFGAGLLLLAKDKNNHYFVDIGKDAGILYRVQSGVKTKLAESVALRLPSKGDKQYIFKVAVTSSGISFMLDGGAEGTDDVVFTDTNASALSTFVGGGIGFVRDLTIDWSTFTVDNVRVVISQYTSGSAPAPAPITDPAPTPVTDPTPTPIVDTDLDGIADDVDNCPTTSNPAQADHDGDGIGNACDPDDDNDGILDINEKPGCQLDPSPLCGNDGTEPTEPIDGGVTDPVTDPATTIRVVTTENLNVRSTPDGTKIGMQPKGSKGTQSPATPVLVNGLQWVYVTFDSSPSGYVAKQYLSIIDDSSGFTEEQTKSEILRLLREIARLQALVDSMQSN